METLGTIIGLIGFFALAAGAVSVVVPLRFIKITSRKMGAGILAAGCTALFVGMWLSPTKPRPTTSAGTAAAKIDQYTIVSAKEAGTVATLAVLLPQDQRDETAITVAAKDIEAKLPNATHVYAYFFNDSRAAGLLETVLQDKASPADSKHYEKHFVGMLTKNTTTKRHRLVIHLEGIGGPEKIIE